jgi:hypothetical protein
MSLSEQFAEPTAGVTGNRQERGMQVLLSATVVASGFVLTPMFQSAVQPLAYALWTVLGGVIVLAGWRRTGGRHLLLTHAEVSFWDTRPAPEALDLTGVKGTISFGGGNH